MSSKKYAYFPYHFYFVFVPYKIHITNLTEKGGELMDISFIFFQKGDENTIFPQILDD